MWIKKPTPVTTSSMMSESWSSENEKSTVKSPERNHGATRSMCGIVGREVNRAAIHNPMRNAAPQKLSATAATVCREKRFPKNPLMAAPARGNSGISQRYRFGGVIV